MRRHVVAVFFFTLCVSFFAVPEAHSATFNAQQKLPANSLSQGLVGWWTFDGTQTTSSEIFDLSATHATGTLSNSPKRVGGRVGQALQFLSGRLHYALFGTYDYDNLTRKTIVAWIKPITLGQGDAGSILNKSNGAFSGWYFDVGNGSSANLRFHEGWNSGATWDCNMPTRLGEWQFVAISYDKSSPSNNPTFYINGESASSTIISPPGAFVPGDTAVVTVLGNNVGISKSFNGLMDEVRIYNRILTPAEIKQLYGLGQVKISSTSGAGKVPTPKILDSSGTVGDFTDIAQGSDGFPVISYYDFSNTDLKFIKCNDLQCNSVITRTLDTAGGRYTSIAIGRDGFPVISYYASLSLRYIKCDDLSCSSYTSQNVDITDVVGPHTSIAIGKDGNAVISYYLSSTADLKFVKCNNASCSSSTIRTLDSSGSVGTYTSLVISRDGYPSITYRGAGELKFIKCHDESCATITTRTLDASADVGAYASMILGKDGFPLISYSDSTNTDLKFIKCHDHTCGTTTTRIIESDGFVGLYTSVTLGRDGNPIISYFDSSNYALTIAKCDDVLCSTHSALMLDDSTGNLYNGTSIAMGSNGTPIISYYDFSNGDLKFIACGAYCGSGVTVGATQSSVIPSGLVGYWSFNGPDVDWRANKAKDRSGQGNDGAIINMSTSTAGKGGKVGQGFRFGSVDYYIDAGSAASLDNIDMLTTSVWVKGVGQVIRKGGNDSSSSWSLANSGSCPSLGFCLLFSHAFSSSDGFWRTDGISKNEWHHLVITYDRTSSSNVPTFYIDGVATSSVTVVAPPGGSADSDASSSVYIGGRPDQSRLFDGILDEVRIYNRILSASEIKALYNAGK